MATNTTTNAALKDASKRHAERREEKFKAAKRLYESGRALKRGGVGVDERTIRQWAAEHGWARGTPE